ncbi:hypothetical protein [Parasphingorhabdus halotolerans]|uniref:DUF3568 family protein n=1 Tax=Parasphingorhabdus halotolerans TaxID=2725558 RepID=A0A6H2DQ26_9SPHN|nr:hypothetical protein [Parasphingorhabdus halotolerans]QJB69861.1 hypothetical protein HF685_11710 [Parasphingorhabdus halotolerans]
MKLLNIKRMAALSALMIVTTGTLSGCAIGSLSGNSSQFNTVETLTLSKRPDNFFDGMVAIGKAQGYQYTGRDASINQINFTDQPNFGQTIIGTSFSINIIVTLKPDGRTVEMRFFGAGTGSSSDAERSTLRIEKLKSAIRDRWQ